MDFESKIEINDDNNQENKILKLRSTIGTHKSTSLIHEPLALTFIRRLFSQ